MTSNSFPSGSMQVRHSKSLHSSLSERAAQFLDTPLGLSGVRTLLPQMQPGPQ